MTDINPQLSNTASLKEGLKQLLDVVDVRFLRKRRRRRESAASVPRRPSIPVGEKEVCVLLGSATVVGSGELVRSLWTRGTVEGRVLKSLLNDEEESMRRGLGITRATTTDSIQG